MFEFEHTPTAAQEWLPTGRAATVPKMSSDRSHHEVARHLRRLRLRALGDKLRESLLFLPSLMLLASGAVALLLAQIDETHQSRPLPWTFTFAPGAASTLLGTIAGAMITTAGVVFSLLVISLQLASGQFSPRVLRGFWRDRFGQVLVGLLLSTFAFCVLALARLDPQAERAPALTVMFGLLLALASVVSIVVYLDRISRQQYVGRIMARVAGETLHLVRELPYGPRVGMRVGNPVPVPDLSALGEPMIVRSPGDGWVQQISRRAVIAAAPPGSTVRLETRVGGYLVGDAPLASIWPRPAEPAAVAALIREVAILGNARTMQQDIDFGLRQLNDIALRALSPAVNDPTTAIEVILRVSSIMRRLVRADLPPQAARDQAGRMLLTPWDLDHGEYIEHGYSQLRRYAGPHLEVMMALMRNLRMLRAACMITGAREKAMAALDKQVEAALDIAAAAGLTEAELAALREAARAR